MTDPDNNPLSRLNPIPDPAAPPGQLAQALRELVRAAGFESLRQLAVRAHVALGRVSEALSGRPNLVPTREVVEAICTACATDEPTRAQLHDLRTTAARSRQPAPAPDDPPPADPASAPGAAPVDPPSPEAVLDDPPPPGPRPRRRWLVSSLAGLVGLVAAGVVGWQLWPQECGGASGIQLNDKTDGECIGVTDGSYLFNDPNKAANDDDRNVIERINDVQHRIQAENSAVAATDRYAKVVLFTPLTVSQARPPAVSLKQILYILEGSYTALVRANHSGAFGDPSAVKLQLWLANQGSLQDADPDFISGILKVSQPDHPVVAMIGMGSSVPNTAVAVKDLAQQGIPMVSAVTSADSLSHLPLLWIVTPGNIEYVGQLKSILDQQNVLKSGIIVYDRNPDLYTQSLAQAYRDYLKPYDLFPDQPFQGGTLGSPAVPDVFFPVVTNLCNAANDRTRPLDMVFYAGRVADFGAFTDALNVRTCRQQPLTVLVGATGFELAQDDKNKLAESHVTVVLATSSDSTSWGRNEPGTPAGYAPFLAAYHASGFVDDGELSDGYLIAHHDALATAAQAIRLAALGRPTQAPTPQDVAGQFGHLNLAFAVPAAAGTLSFPPEGGRATGLPIPIEQVG